MLAVLTLSGAVGMHVSGKKRASENLLSFVPPPFSSHEKRGCGERGAGVSLLSVVMLFVFMPTDREGECAGHSFLLRFRPSILTD